MITRLVPALLVFPALTLLLAACSGNEATPAPDESSAAGEELISEGQLHGIWLLDGGNVLVRFSTADETYAIDDSGLLGLDPDDEGTYTLDRRTLTLTSSEGSRECEAGDRTVWDVGLLPTLELATVVIEDECGGAEGTELTWTSVGVAGNPDERSETEIDAEAGGGQPPRESELIGIWKEQDGAHVVRFGEDGSYAIDENLDLDTKPDESGTFRLTGNTLTFESGAESVVCVGDRWIWELDYVEDGQLKGTPVDYVEDGEPNFGCQIGRDIGEEYRLFRISP